MRKHLLAGLGLAALMGMGTAAWAQVPAAPVVPAAAVPPGAPVVPVAGGPAAPAAGGARNLFSFFCMTPEQKAACKEKICRSGIGQLLNGAVGPLSGATGGVIPPLCPPALPSDLLKPADSAEGAAARIAADEANAKARRKAVRYLATVDCRYWPEATEALVNALRADRNECVRLEAAIALGKGCCCNKATIRALTLTINCSDEDGNPIEASPRVREAAEVALIHCLECYSERAKPAGPAAPGALPPPRPEVKPISPKVLPPVIPPEKEGEGEGVPEGTGKKDQGKDKTGNVDKNGAAKARSLPAPKPVPKAAAKAEEENTPAAYYRKVAKMKWSEVVEPARLALAKRAARAQAPSGRSISEIMGRSMGYSSPVRGHTAAPPAAVQPAYQAAPGRQAAATTSLFPSLFRRSNAMPVPSSQVVVVSAQPPVVQPTAPTSAVAPALPAPTPLPVTTTAPVTPAEQEQPRKVYSTASPVPQPYTTTAPTPPASPRPPLGPTERSLPALPGPQPTVSQATGPSGPSVRLVDAAPARRGPEVSFAPAAGRQGPQVVLVPASAPEARIVQTTYAPASRVPAARLMPVRPLPTGTAQSADALLEAFSQSADIQRREWIVRQLGRLGGAASDHRVVALLIRSAESDPAALVRIACLESIQSLKISHGRLPDVLAKLKRDEDVRVRLTAEEMAHTH